MQVESKDGKIRFFFEKEAQTEQEEEAQKKAVLSAVEEIRKMKKINLKLIIIVLIFSISALLFHFYVQKVQQNPEYIAQIQSENLEIEQNIVKQILDRKAKELGLKPIHSQNPDIKNYLNLYLQKSTTIWDSDSNTAITYNGQDIVVKAVKLANGNTIFTLKNKNYYLKEE